MLSSMSKEKQLHTVPSYIAPHVSEDPFFGGEKVDGVPLAAFLPKASSHVHQTCRNQQDTVS